MDVYIGRWKKRECPIKYVYNKVFHSIDFIYIVPIHNKVMSWHSGPDHTLFELICNKAGEERHFVNKIHLTTIMRWGFEHFFLQPVECFNFICLFVFSLLQIKNISKMKKNCLVKRSTVCSCQWLLSKLSAVSALKTGR